MGPSRKTARQSRQGLTPPPAKNQHRTEPVQEPLKADSKLAADSFTITAITPLPSGTTDEVWTALKDRLTKSGVGPAIPTVMEHGSLISFGPTEVDIGFHKAIYKEKFERAIQDKPELGEILREFFGEARIRILTLASETSLRAVSPYAPSDERGTGLERALKTEAMDHPVVKAVLSEFDGSFIEDILLDGKQ